jgi:aminopeptidase N
MMKTLLGPDKFAKALDIYFDRHDGDAATVEDFVACMEDASGRDMTQFFHWYNEAGTPAVTARLSWDEAQSSAQLDIRQSLAPTPGQPSKPALHMPLVTGLIGPDGRDMALKLQDGSEVPGGVLELREERQSWTFSGITKSRCCRSTAGSPHRSR